MKEIFASKTFKIALIDVALTIAAFVTILLWKPDTGVMEAVGAAKLFGAGLNFKQYQQAQADRGKVAAKIDRGDQESA